MPKTSLLLQGMNKPNKLANKIKFGKSASEVSGEKWHRAQDVEKQTSVTRSFAVVVVYTTDYNIYNKYSRSFTFTGSTL